MHLELTFPCELTVKEDLHGVCVQVGSLSSLPYPALSVSHGLQFHTKHPFPEIWIGLLGSFSLLNLCSACFLASTQGLEIYDCSRNAFPGEMPAFSYMCVPKGYCLSQLLCLPDGQNQIFKKTFRKVYSGGKRIYRVLLFCEHKKLQRLCAKLLSPEPIRKDEKNRDERNGRGWNELYCPQMSRSPLAGCIPFALLLLSALLQPAFCPRATCMDCTDRLWKLLASLGLCQWGAPAGDWREGRNWGPGPVLGCFGLAFPLALDNLFSQASRCSVTQLLGSGPSSSLCPYGSGGGRSSAACSSGFLHYYLWFPLIHLGLCDQCL